jgi:hypothetical protein
MNRGSEKRRLGGDAADLRRPIQMIQKLVAGI